MHGKKQLGPCENRAWNRSAYYFSKVHCIHSGPWYAVISAPP